MGDRRVAIVQSSYVPWKGFYDLVAGVDELVLLDDVQFTRRDWRNRNRIKTAQGLRWLTVPVRSRGRYTQRIDETEISDPMWAERHWLTLRHAYGRAPCFEQVAGAVEGWYADAARHELLTHVNEGLLRAVCDALGIGTAISRSDGTVGDDDATRRLVALARSRDAAVYVSGPTARAYLDEAAFASEGIRVEWMDYGPYPEYAQLHGPFEHHVTVLDVLFHTGADAARHVRSVPARAGAA